LRLARAMSGAEAVQDAQAQSVEMGGTSVLRVAASADAGGDIVYVYLAEDAAFTIVSHAGGTSAAASLVAELP
jgi:hypothetical protein